MELTGGSGDRFLLVYHLATCFQLGFLGHLCSSDHSVPAYISRDPPEPIALVTPNLQGTSHTHDFVSGAWEVGSRWEPVEGGVREQEESANYRTSQGWRGAATTER